MNIQEKKYVIKRISEISQKLMQDTVKKYPGKAYKQLNEKEKIELIASSKVSLYTSGKIRKNSNNYKLSGLSKVFDFSYYEWDAEQNDKYSIVMALIIDEKIRISDEVMLGDSEEAMKALKMFANFSI